MDGDGDFVSVRGSCLSEYSLAEAPGNRLRIRFGVTDTQMLRLAPGIGGGFVRRAGSIRRGDFPVVASIVIRC